MKISSLFTLLLILTLQFAIFSSLAVASNQNTDDFSDDIPQESSRNKSSDDTDTFSNGKEVKPSDIEALKKAIKSKSESAILKATENILAADPNHLETLNALGMHYFQMQKFGLAKIIFKRAQKAHPDEPALQNNLGIISLSEGDLRAALEYFKKSVQAKGNYRIGATNLSSIYLDYRDYKRSLSPLEDAYEASRSDLRQGQDKAVEIANNYAVALMGTGDDSKAREVFEQIIKSDTRKPQPYLNYVILLVEVQKKKNDAIKAISKLKFITDDSEILKQVRELEKKLE